LTRWPVLPARSWAQESRARYPSTLNKVNKVPRFVLPAVLALLILVVLVGAAMR
jgi:hypothetical protein